MLRAYKIILFFICLLIGILFLSRATKAGRLDDFEKDFILKPKENENTNKEGICPSEDSCLGSIFESCLEDLISTLIFNGGSTSYERVHIPADKKENQPAPGSSSILVPRQIGDPLIPFIRLDLGYRDVESDVEACEWLIQLGYGPFGFQFLQTYFWEDDPEDTLKINQIHGLGRLSISEYIELDLGLGASIMADHIGLSVTSPLLIYPWEMVGFEFRPVWSSINETPLNDYDLSLALRWYSISLLTGYRWTMSPHDSLNGPKISLSFRL